MSTIKTINKQAKVVEVEKRWLDRQEAAKYSSMSVEWIKKKNLSGELSFYKPGGPGGKVLINIADLDRLINKSKVI